MEWRCEWCGKPHESDDPPCDNCGHHEFEKAVERVPATADQPQGSVWVCPECGRQHQKHSPPCSRCGNLELEQRDVADLDDPLEDIGTGWRDVIEAKYVAGYVAVGVLLLVLGLGFVGVIDLPGMGEPTIPDAPGNADTAGNLSLAEVEAEYVAEVNERRDAAGASSLRTDETLGRLAAYYNKAIVDATYDDGDGPNRDAIDRFDHDCSSPPDILRHENSAGPDGAAIVTAESPEAAASALVERVENGARFDDLLDATRSSVGVDVHVAPDDRVFVTIVVC
jgi:DNA-directed RNA polymerase subunit RPC12/RpoP